jgi:hypothetical protein
MDRSLGWHLTRGAMVTAYFVALCLVLRSSFGVSAPGLAFLERITQLNLAFCTLVAIGCFSVCVTSERDAGTLDLLKLTGMGPIGFLLGRWLPVLLATGMLLVLQIPFTLLAVTLGGVLPVQVWGVTVAALVHLFLVASLALFVSVVARTSLGAVLISLVSFGICFLGPAVVTQFWPGLPQPFANVLERVNSLTAFASVERILFPGKASPSLWSVEQTWQVLIALVALGLSRLSFESLTSGIPATTTRQSASQRRPQWATGLWAVFWKDFSYTAGGWRWFAIRLIVYPVVGTWYVESLGGGFNRSAWIALHDTSLRVVGWDTAIVLSQLYQREVREQTWDALRLLPVPQSQVIYSKLAGVLLALSPGWVWAGFVSVNLARPGTYGTSPLDLVFFVSIVCLGCHVATLVSVLFPRFTWTVALMVGVVAATLELEIARSMVIAAGFGIAHKAVVAGLLIVTIAICVGLHVAITSRIQQLSD